MPTWYPYLFPLILGGFVLWAQLWRLHRHAGRPARERFIYGTSLASAFLVLGALRVTLTPYQLLVAAGITILLAPLYIWYYVTWFRARLKGAILLHPPPRRRRYLVMSLLAGLFVFTLSRTFGLHGLTWFVAGVVPSWWLGEVFALAYLVAIERRTGAIVVDAAEGDRAA